jgi:hypothetical protein
VRVWVRRKPLWALGGAAVLGLLLSARPRALSSILVRLIPAALLLAYKPLLQQLGRDLGASLGAQARALRAL